MKNHDASTAPAPIDSPGSGLMRAFFKGAGSGALMMGIFSGLIFAAKATGLSVYLGMGQAAGWSVAVLALPGMLGMVAVGMLATGLFSAIMANSRANAAASHAPSAHVARERWSGPEQSYVPVPVAAPMLADAVETTPTTQWRDHAEHSRAGRDSIDSILARGDISAKERAAAILSVREQSSTLENAR